MNHDQLLEELHGLVTDLYIALSDHCQEGEDNTTVIEDAALQKVIDRMENIDIGLPDEPGFVSAVGAKVRYALSDKCTKNLDPEIHKLDQLVDGFALCMKDKLRSKHERSGNLGWDGPDWKPHLPTIIHEHVEKGDPVDVANLAAFWWHHNSN